MTAAALAPRAPDALRIVDEAPKPTIVVINVGTPDAPETPAVRRYLDEFLGDPLFSFVVDHVGIFGRGVEV